MPKRKEPTEPEKAPDLLTVAETARALRLDPTTIRRYIKDGLIDAIQLPERGMYRIQRTTIDNILKRREGDLPTASRKTRDTGAPHG